MRKNKILACSTIFLCTLVSLSACCIVHDWKEATCTEPMICEECGKTTGEPLGHNWEEATCIDAKTCERCGTTDGDALGHTIKEWHTILDPTCTKEGTLEGTCVTCGVVETQVLPKIAHIPGDWIVVTEAALYQDGERTKSCTVCGEVVSKETFKLTEEEMEEALKNAQEMIVTNVNVSGVGFLNSNDVSVTVKNVSDKVVKEYIVGMLCFDRDGYPVVPRYNDSNLVLGKDTVNIQPGKSAGDNGSWTVFSSTKLYAKACVKSVEYHDGSSWDNPYFYIWYLDNKDRY